MIPIHLCLSGFLSYLDPVDIDFTSFDIACISGANGAGKSSLLDAMTWVLFGQARRRDDSVINSHARGAEVTFDIEYEGNQYRIQRIKMRDKSVVLEFFVCAADGNWKVLTEHSMRDTELRIQQTLRLDYETFINASFFLQGKADLFAQQRPADRKRILSSILGLEVWEIYRNGAATRRKQLESELAVLDGNLGEIVSELNQESERRKRLSELEEQLAQLQALRQAKETAMENLRRLSASLEEQRRLLEVLAGQFESAQKRKLDSETHLQQRLAEQQQYSDQLAAEKEVLALYQRWQECRIELERWESVAVNFRQFEQQRAAPNLIIETERTRLQSELQTLRTQDLAIQQSLDRLPGLKVQIDEALQTLADLAAQMNRRPLLEEELRRLQADHTDTLAENKGLREEMRDLRERIDRLKEANGGLCPVCGQPLSPEECEHLIEDLEGQGRDKAARFRANQEQVRLHDNRQSDLETAIAAFNTVETDLRNQQRKTDQMEDVFRQTQTALQTWESGGAIRLVQVAAMLENQDFAYEARAELAGIDASLKELGYDAAAHAAVRQAELADRKSEEQLRQLETARAALAPLAREVKRLEKQLEADTTDMTKQEQVFRLAETKYQEAADSMPDMNQAERELFSMVEQENRMRYQVGGARQSVQVLDTLRKRQADYNIRRTALGRQIGQLKMLEKAFGKDGVPALLIEQSLPEIETISNQILDRLSGGVMSVHFETQRTYKDKNRDDMRETLDIKISDEAGQRDYELFSGGEAFRVNFAIRLALSRFLAQRAGARLQTLIIDEGFGSQDVEGRQRLIEAINMVRDDFAKILVITHMEELKEAFPVRLEVEKTSRGSMVRVI